jgi:eukaryotic-like serine/threonine-protein kinase
MLAPGARLGVYEIVARIGDGGMGEVYRARDTKLNRDVAIKVLPASLTNDPDRLARFSREAQVLASLNHPNIAAIHHVEETSDGPALVMELVEGETLADRIARGPIPLEEALPIAKQIAEALEAAHEQGIIHRDLKPANIKVRPDGTVKVLDFGLAKLAETSSSRTSDISLSPTITSPAMMTGVGVLLGTAAYMSPEQAKGKPADKRSDIWAFGCVLFEILTGRRAFDGETTTEVLARVLERDPDLNRLPPTVSANVVRLLRRCLERDPRRRLRDIGDVRFELEEPDVGSEALVIGRLSAPASGVRALGQRPLILGLGMLFGAAIAGAAIWLLSPAPSGDIRNVATFTIALPRDQGFTGTLRHVVALSPRGTHLVYVANNGLYLRAINQLTAAPIQGTSAAPGSVDPFFSPDGQWIGFWQNGELKKVAITGGSPVKLCDVPEGTSGASWSADDTIVFGRGGGGISGIWRVSSQGGPPERLVTVDEKRAEAAYGPQLLPGGREVLFTLGSFLGGGGWNDAQIVVQSLDSGERKVFVKGGRDARYLETGHLVYARSGALLAVPFDLARLEVRGGPVPLIEGVRDAGVTTGSGATHFSLSGDGTLVYVPGNPEQETQRKLVWVDRAGAEQPLTAPARAYDFPQLSPDGQRVAVEIGPQVWLVDLSRDTLTRFTFEGPTNETPHWTPDGKRIVFSSSKEGPRNLFSQLADGSGGLERLTTSEQLHIPTSLSPDGQLLVFHESATGSQRNISVLRLSDHKVQPFLRTPFNEGGTRFSPDGRWLAYVSNESGRPEIYVQPYPGPGGKWQVSTEGGTEPAWNRNGRELFYRSGNKMMTVETTTEPSFTVGKPRMLFEAEYLAAAFPQLGSDYDVSADGKRFLMVKEIERAQSTAEVTVVLNWLDELKRRVPTK